MENQELNKFQENNEEENDLYKFENFTLYTDRIVELLNKNIIDYSSKS
jgi:hypothetical protein